MTLRFEGIGRIGFVALTVLVACGESDPAPGNGTAGSGGSAAGTASTAGTGGSGTAGSMAGSGTAGSSAGSTAAGSNSGGAGGSAGGAGGTGGSAAGTSGSGGSGGAKSKTTFFVTSDSSKTGKIGGLDGADKRCQDLAKAAGFGDHTFKAYLSTSTVNAKDRIGTGPWVNSKGVTLAENLAALHALKGNADLFIDEKQQKINGQWQGSPTPNMHDIFTGSAADGTVMADMTCTDWTSDSAQQKAQIGHSDGLGPNGDTANGRDSWNSAHANGSCADTAPAGGAGKLYCFAVD